MSERMIERMSEDMSERMPERMSQDMPEIMSQRMPERTSGDMPHRMQKICLKERQKMFYGHFVKLRIAGLEIRQGKLGEHGSSRGGDEEAK